LPVLLLGLPGCDWIGEKGSEKVAETAVEKSIESQTGEKADVDISNGKVEVKGKGKDGNEVVISSGADVPKDWPSNVPVYPGAKVISSIALSEQGWSLVLSSSDGPDKVAEFYESKLTGFEKEASLDTGAMKTRHFKAADGMVVNVVAATGKSDGQTGIQLSVNKPKPKP
jgi:hypothetical protein